MQTTDFIWMDGEFVPWEKATVHVMTHALHYGTAIFEGIRCYDTAKGPMVFRLPEHVDRLFYSAKAIDLDIPYSKEEIMATILETIRRNNMKACYIRPLVYYGYKKLGPPPIDVPTKIAILVVPYDPFLGDKPVRTMISSYMRIHPKSSVMGAKISGHYTNSALAELEAHKKGYDEAILLDDQGNIAEGGAVNFFMISGNTLITPTERAILPGITRASLMELARDKMGMTVEERDIAPEELTEADEAFFCGTATEVAAIAEVGNISDGGVVGNVSEGGVVPGGGAVKFGDAPKTRELKELYKRVVTGEEEGYEGWLSGA